MMESRAPAKAGGTGQRFSRLLVLAGLSAALVVAGAQPTAAQQPAIVQVDPVITEPLVQTVPILGRIVTKQEGPVAAQVAAPVARLEVEVGDRVEEDELLAVLDVTRLKLDEALAEADVKASEAEVLAARRTLELLDQERSRLVQLEGSAAFSKARLDDKINEISVAASGIDAAEARLARARVMLDYRQADLTDAEVRAPYPGVVVERHVSAGAHVQVGQPVVTLVDDTALEVEAEVPAERLAELEPGIEIAFDLADGGVYEAVLRAVVPVENPRTRTRSVRFAAKNGDLKSARAIGQSVTVELPLGAPREVVTVHKDAVTVSLQGRQVFVVDEDDNAQPRPVVLGAAVGNRFEVLEGLAPGELVVVRGNERLRPGQAVAYGNPKEQGQGGTPATGERS